MEQTPKDKMIKATPKRKKKFVFVGKGKVEAPTLEEATKLTNK